MAGLNAYLEKRFPDLAADYLRFRFGGEYGIWWNFKYDINITTECSIIIYIQSTCNINITAYIQVTVDCSITGYIQITVKLSITRNSQFISRAVDYYRIITFSKG